MRSGNGLTKTALIAATLVGGAAWFGWSTGALAAPVGGGVDSALATPSEAERAEQRHRARLMLGLNTAQENLAARAPYWQDGKRDELWVVNPVRGQLQDATELALTRAPDALPLMVAINQVVVRFEGKVELNQAATILRAAGFQGEVRETLAPSGYIVRTRSALEALRGADRLQARADVRFAQADGLGAMVLTDQAPAGTAPEIRVESLAVVIPDAGMVDFGATTQTVSVSRSFDIFNDGDANLVIEVPTVMGDFALQMGPSSTTIPPGGSVQFVVQMPAAAAGAQAGTVSFLNNDGDENPFDINLTGTVNAPGGPQEIRVTVDGTEVNVGDTVEYGETTQGIPRTLTYTVSNIGGATLTLGTVTVPTGYTLVTAPSMSVNSGNSTEFTVRLDATAQGLFAGVVSFLNNDGDENPFEITVTGTVTEALPNSEIEVYINDNEVQSGGAASFGNTDEGVPVALTAVIRNTGMGELILGAVRVPAGFSLAQAPPGVIEPNSEGTVTFTLDALYGGAFSGSITIDTDDADEDPFVLSASGFVLPMAPTGGIDDANFVNQWHHENDGSEGGAMGYDVRTPEAWATTLGAGAMVAVMDNGSQPEQPDYNDNVAGEYLNQIDTFGSGTGEHGTAVAGCVAAEANFSGGRGTAPEALLFLTNTFNIGISEAADAFYAADLAGADIHTNSWGFIDPNFFPDALRDAIQDLAVNGRGGLGMSILFAATNNTRPVIWSSSLSVMPETIAVGALTNGGGLAGYSDYGPWVDYVAPSSGGSRRIFTTDLTGVRGYNQAQSASGGDFTTTFGGTSAATPISAGVLALVYSVNADLHTDQVRRIMRKTARDVLVVDNDRPFEKLVGFSDSFGYGLIDANAAVAAAVASLSNGNLTWPEPVTGLQATRAGNGGVISWINPSVDVVQNEFAGAMLIRYSGPLLWTPVDGVAYTVGTMPSTGVTVMARGADVVNFVDIAVTAATNTAYAVYTFNAVNNYSDPAVARIFPREPTEVFFDDMEDEDPGWTFILDDGGPLFGLPPDEGTNEWQRGVPTLDTIEMEGTYSCNGAPCNLGQFLGSPIAMFPPIVGFNQAFSGTNVWDTDLDGVYAPNSVHRLVSPQIDLRIPELGSFSLSWEELLEVQGGGGDVGRVFIVDADSGNVIRTLINVHQAITYEWREQWFDIRNQRNKIIKVVFELSTDDFNQFQGWSIDDFRVAGSVGSTGPIPPVGPRRIILPGFGIPTELAPDVGSGGDINYDGLVTLEDAAVLVQRWGETQQRSDFSYDADLDGNGRIGVGDLALMLTIVQEQQAAKR